MTSDVSLALAQLVHGSWGKPGSLIKLKVDIPTSQVVVAQLLASAVAKLDVLSLVQDTPGIGPAMTVMDYIIACVQTGNQHLLEDLSKGLATLPLPEASLSLLALFHLLDDLVQTLPQSFIPVHSLRRFYFVALPLFIGRMAPVSPVIREMRPLPNVSCGQAKKMDMILRPVFQTGDMEMLIQV